MLNLNDEQKEEWGRSLVHIVTPLLLHTIGQPGAYGTRVQVTDLTAFARKAYGLLQTFVPHEHMRYSENPFVNIEDVIAIWQTSKSSVHGEHSAVMTYWGNVPIVMAHKVTLNVEPTKTVEQFTGFMHKIDAPMVVL